MARDPRAPRPGPVRARDRAVKPEPASRPSHQRRPATSRWLAATLVARPRRDCRDPPRGVPKARRTHVTGGEMPIPNGGGDSLPRRVADAAHATARAEPHILPGGTAGIDDHRARPLPPAPRWPNSDQCITSATPKRSLVLRAGQRAGHRTVTVADAASAPLSSGSAGPAPARARTRSCSRHVAAARDRSPTSAQVTSSRFDRYRRFRSESEDVKEWRAAKPADRKTNAGTESGSYSSAVVASETAARGAPRFSAPGRMPERVVTVSGRDRDRPRDRDGGSGHDRRDPHSSRRSTDRTPVLMPALPPSQRDRGHSGDQVRPVDARLNSARP